MTDSLKLLLHLAVLLTWIDLRILVVHNGHTPPGKAERLQRLQFRPCSCNERCQRNVGGLNLFHRDAVQRLTGIRLISYRLYRETSILTCLFLLTSHTHKKHLFEIEIIYKPKEKLTSKYIYFFKYPCPRGNEFSFLSFYFYTSDFCQQAEDSNTVIPLIPLLSSLLLLLLFWNI